LIPLALFRVYVFFLLLFFLSFWLAATITELVDRLNRELTNKFPGGRQENFGYPDFHQKEFFDREVTIQQLATRLPQVWRSFVKKSPTNAMYPFYTLFTGSGMGKTRFGREAPSEVKKSKRE
jgi:hypothetical protein